MHQTMRKIYILQDCNSKRVIRGLYMCGYNSFSNNYKSIQTDAKLLPSCERITSPAITDNR